MSGAPEVLRDTEIPALLQFIQANLDEDLTLEGLSRHCEIAPFVLHRHFRRVVGETPGAYVNRVRLDQAAKALTLHDARVLDVALEHGFRNHETFTRAFRRRFHVSPRQFRNEGRLIRHLGPKHGDDDPAQDGYTLGRTRVQLLRPVTLLSQRRLGAYETVPDRLWDQLMAHCDSLGLPTGALLGIGRDNPATTAPDQLRFDACVVIEGRYKNTAGFFTQTLPPGPWAVTRHAGAYQTLTAAMPEIAQRSAALDGFQLAGLPLVEVYHTHRMRSDAVLNHTDVYFPLLPDGD